jgi:hypothetical protein
MHRVKMERSLFQNRKEWQRLVSRAKVGDISVPMRTMVIVVVP